MKNWIIKKEQQNENAGDQGAQLCTVGGVHSMLAITSESSSSPVVSMVEHDSQHLVPSVE
jgi:hypothetical protein